MKDNTTIIICCAGMGTRLGIGTTKALVDVGGKPLILHQLSSMADCSDIRIVVGYHAEQLIKAVNKERTDVMYAFNYDYASTGPAASLNKALMGAKEYIVTIDGDVLIHPDDFRAILEYPGECIAFTEAKSDEPVIVQLESQMITEFNSQATPYEWPGIAKIKKSRLAQSERYIYEMLTPLLPIKGQYVRARSIDTPEDYDRAMKWIENNYEEL